MNKVLIAALLLAATNALGQIRLPEASPEAVVSQEVGISKVTLTFHRPAVKGRQVWGNLVPMGQVWRLGANEATTIELSHAARIDGAEVPAGKYALFAIPGADQWTLILNKQAAQWGAYFYKQDQDLLRFNVRPQKAAFRETFDIDLIPTDEQTLQATVHWEQTQVPFTIRFDTPSLVWAQIDRALASAPSTPEAWETWHQAARYALSTGKRMEEGLTWIDKAMVKESFWNYEVKARLLQKLGRTGEAIPLIEKAKEMSKDAGAPQEYREGLDRTISEWRRTLS